jgi:AcrR family transcriptional regulator
MDNASRSERTRDAVLEAALSIIARDGPGRLTLDAIAQEAGMSKGRLLHQFPTKQAILKAILERQRAYYLDFSRRYIAEAGTGTSQPELAAQIATLREATITRHPVAFAILGAMADDPDLLSVSRNQEARNIDAIKAETDDPQLAMLRKAAAQGLALTAILGMSSLSNAEREELFDRLLDDEQWSALSKPCTRPGNRRKPPAKTRAR